MVAPERLVAMKAPRDRIRHGRAAVRVVATLLLLAGGGCGDDASASPAHADGSVDGGPGPVSDAAAADAGGWDAARPEPDEGPPWRPPSLQALALPDPDEADGEYLLSQTGLYQDIASKQLAPDLLAFEPRFALWSDGAKKARWLRVPEGTLVDSSEMDHWRFPIGTMAFKQFSQAGKRIETRLIVRTGEGDEDYWMGAFAWNDDESDAVFVPMGRADARGTQHDVPRVKLCFTCHRGDAGRILGFSAVQQPDAEAGLFTDPPMAFDPPGTPDEVAALGYLHANCAHCHNPNGTARPDTDMNLRLSVLDRAVEETATYATTLGVELQYFEASALDLRVAPGLPDESGLLLRMGERGQDTQMPPIATERVDPEGMATVRSWIERL